MGVGGGCVCVGMGVCGSVCVGVCTVCRCLYVCVGGELCACACVCVRVRVCMLLCVGGV